MNPHYFFSLFFYLLFLNAVRYIKVFHAFMFSKQNWKIGYGNTIII